MKIGLFFGAGAEIGYGLPSGGQFAIDLFRQDLGRHKQAFKEQLNQINTISRYATNWLPSDFNKKRLHAFSKGDYTNLIESSIEYKKNEIIRKLNSFDTEVEYSLKQLGIEKSILETKYEEVLGDVYGDEVYSTAIKLNPKLAEEVQLFGSEFYSALLSICRTEHSNPEILRYTGAFLQLLVGAHGQDLIQKLNQDLFEEAPDDIPIFDDISGLFKIEFNRGGIQALELLLESDVERSHDTLENILLLVCKKTLENIFTSVLDYQSLIDNHFRYLFSPKNEWSKFCKMVIFLRATREYIKEKLDGIDERSSDGYYHDLKTLKDIGIELVAVGTSNYNNLIEEIFSEFDFPLPSVQHLNGSVNDYYNPYKNSVTSFETPDSVPASEIHVPFILTQSGLKPLTSVDMSRRYVQLYDDYSKCDKIVIIGYGFNIDDSHINGLFRQIVEIENKKLVWVCLEDEGTKDEQKRLLISKLRINNEFRSNISVITVDKENRQFNGKNWTNQLLIDP